MRRALLLLLAATGCLAKPDFSGGGGDDTPVAVIDPHFAVGNNHACAIDNAQQLWCWGTNDDGQLGTNDPTPVATPVRVGTETGWTAVSAGRTHTCGILAGEVHCWGAGNVNQTDGAQHPEDRIDLGGFVPTRLFAHEYGTCVLDAAGAMRCWGQPALATTQATAVDPGGRGLAIAQVAFNQDHGCAVATDGTIYCWGSNQYGQLGVDGGDAIDPGTARPRTGSYLAVAVQGVTTCAVTTGHALECWGNVDPSLFAGMQPATPTSTGTIIDSAHPWGALSLSQSFACGDAAGGIFCWGYSDTGQLGDGFGYHDIRLAPAMTGATGVITGDGFTCARDASGKISCWGHDRYGNLGTGEVARVQAPVAVPIAPALPTNDTFSFIAAGARHMCAVTKTGLVYCWGDNGVGQVDPAPSAAPLYATPHLVPNTSAVRIGAGTDHTCAIDLANNSAKCWGSNFYSQLGAATATFTTATVPGPFDWISAGDAATCGITNGLVECWGRVPGQDLNLAGDAPVVIAQISSKPWTEVAVGDDHVIATNDTQIWGWGEACAATGATGATISPAMPQPVAGLAAGSYDLAAASHGGAGSCAITSSALACWGANKATQLQSTDPAACIPATTTRPLAGPLAGPNSSSRGDRLALAGSHGCTLTSSLTLQCWGDDDELPIGPRPDNTPSDTILQQFGLVHWSQIAIGPAAGCGIADDPTVIRCWGTSPHGELGNGTSFRAQPVPTLFTP